MTSVQVVRRDALPVNGGGQRLSGKHPNLVSQTAELVLQPFQEEPDVDRWVVSFWQPHVDVGVSLSLSLFESTRFGVGLTCWCSAGNERIFLTNQFLWFPLRGPGSFPHSLLSTSKLKGKPQGTPKPLLGAARLGAGRFLCADHLKPIGMWRFSFWEVAGFGDSEEMHLLAGAKAW